METIIHFRLLSQVVEDFVDNNYIMKSLKDSYKHETRLDLVDCLTELTAKANLACINIDCYRCEADKILYTFALEDLQVYPAEIDRIRINQMEYEAIQFMLNFTNGDGLLIGYHHITEDIYHLTFKI